MHYLEKIVFNNKMSPEIIALTKLNDILEKLGIVAVTPTVEVANLPVFDRNTLDYLRKTSLFGTAIVLPNPEYDGNDEVHPVITIHKQTE